MQRRCDDDRLSEGRQTPVQAHDRSKPQDIGASGAPRHLYRDANAWGTAATISGTLSLFSIWAMPTFGSARQRRTEPLGSDEDDGTRASGRQCQACTLTDLNRKTAHNAFTLRSPRRRLCPFFSVNQYKLAS